MRAIKLAILGCLVLVSFGALLLAGSRALTFSCLSRLDAGEPGVVGRMLEKGMARDLEEYHMRQLRACAINLPPASPYANAATHPRVERFFYVDAAGNVTIRGLSDRNIPPDLSQRALLFVDARLTWFKMRLLLDAFISERIRYVHLAGLTSDGRLAYTFFEVTAPGAFPMLYPHRICLLKNDASYYYIEDVDPEITRLGGFEDFRQIAEQVLGLSIAKRPFMRLLAMDSVTCDAVYRTLTMFKPAGVQALVKLRTDDREYILASIAQFRQAGEKTPGEEEEE